MEKWQQILNKQVSRRSALGLGVGAVVTISCSGSTDRKPTPSAVATFTPIPNKEAVFGPEEPIRRSEGNWTDSDVENLSRKMLSQTELTEIPFAGSILMKNVKGQPSFSEETSLFTDLKLIFKTQRLLPGNPLSPIATLPDYNVGTIVTLPVFKANGERVGTTTGRSSMALKLITISTQATQGHSDFFLMFGAAKEIMNYKGFAMGLEYTLNRSGYKVPDDQKQKNTLMLKMFDFGYSDYGDMPTQYMSDLWAQFLMIPDYLKAKESSKFSSSDLATLRLTDAAANDFINNSVLSKNADGKYIWTQDKNKFYDNWVRVAGEIYTGKLPIAP